VRMGKECGLGDADEVKARLLQPSLPSAPCWAHLLAHMVDQDVPSETMCAAAGGITLGAAAGCWVIDALVAVPVRALVHRPTTRHRIWLVHRPVRVADSALVHCWFTPAAAVIRAKHAVQSLLQGLCHLHYARMDIRHAGCLINLAAPFTRCRSGRCT
jgi:hypothetical protein